MAVWLITGASRGLGKHLVLEALAKGDQVVAISRNGTTGIEPHPDLLDLKVDLTRADAVKSAIGSALQRFGRLDNVINNAGRGLLGAIEEASDADVQAVFDLNFNAVLNVLRAALPVLRAQRLGNVVNISSLAGISGAASWGIYSASKFAVEGLSEALAKETAALGIKVLIVEPGILRTDFLDDQSLLVSETVIHDYDSSAGAARRGVSDNRGNQPGDPRLSAQRIIEQVSAGLPEDGLASRLILGSDAGRVIGTKLALLNRQIAETTPLAGSIDIAVANA